MTNEIKNIPSCTQPIEAIESRIQTIRGKQDMRFSAEKKSFPAEEMQQTADAIFAAFKQLTK